ncbi:MAG: hypothetical protein ACI861_002476 [Paracoccaceae bacterium]|jgi:hypothetical protein
MNKTTLLASAAILAGSLSIAQAGLVDDVIGSLGKLGYTSIEVEDNGDTITVEATLDGEEHEITYDKATGDVLSDEVDGDGSGEDGSADGSGDGSADGSADGGSADGSSGGDASAGSGGSGGGGDTAFLMDEPVDYLTGGHGGDIEFG